MDYLEIAKKAALKAGEIQLRNLNKIKNISFKDTKGKNNILTEIDTECEEVILSIIKGTAFQLMTYLPRKAVKTLQIVRTISGSSTRSTVL